MTHESDDGALTVVTLRKVEVARQFPQEFPADAMGLPRGTAHACQSCGEALKPVVITTGGPYGDPAVWAAYPLALDGWQCEGCGEVSAPAFLEAGEMKDLLDQAVADARAGRFDEAEFGFRRAVSSWPGYALAHANFGSICLDRVKALQDAGADAEAIARYVELAAAQLRTAVACDPPPPAIVSFMLGKLLVRKGEYDEGAAALRAFLAGPEVPEPLRAEAEALLQQ